MNGKDSFKGYPNGALVNEGKLVIFLQECDNGKTIDYLKQEKHQLSTNRSTYSSTSDNEFSNSMVISAM